MTEYSFTAPLWLSDGKSGAWTLITTPESIADAVDELQTGPRRGFGAVRVRATIGTSTWETSVFPSAKQASLVMPVNRKVRQREGIQAGDVVTVSFDLVDRP